MSAAQKTANDLKKEYPEFWHSPFYTPSGWAKDIDTDDR